MRKMFVFAAMFMFIVLRSNGQLTQNNWLVGGNLSYKTSKSNGEDAVNSTSRVFTIAPDFGYFLIDKLAAGLRMDAIFDRQKYPQPDGSSSSIVTNSVGLGPFVRYYFFSMEGRVNLLADGAFFYKTAHNKSTGSDRSTYKAFDYSVLGGPVVFFNSSVALELLLGYSHTKAKDIDSKGSSFQLKIGFQFYLEPN